MLSFKNYLNEELKKQEGTQMGSNDGGIHVDTDTGQKHYVKYYKNGDQAKVEALTGKIYNHMGIKTLNPEHKEINGRHTVVTPFNDKLKGMKPHDFEKLDDKQHKQIGKMYHAGILTKNWDVVGLEHDNIMKHKDTGDLHAIDHGGSMHFRAQGAPKPYGSDIDEHHSFRNFGGASSHVFNHAFRTHPEAEKHGIEAVKKIDDNHVHGLFKNSGLHNWEALHKSFSERKKNLIAHYDNQGK